MKPAVTVPKTPEFSSFRRKQTTSRGFSTAEEEQLEDMKKHQFKARPVNAQSMIGPRLPVDDYICETAGSARA